MVGSALFAKAPAVDEKLYLRQVGINGDPGHILNAVNVALAADMNKRFIRKPCLICVEAVLLVLTVKGH